MSAIEDEHHFDPGSFVDVIVGIFLAVVGIGVIEKAIKDAAEAVMAKTDSH